MPESRQTTKPIVLAAEDAAIVRRQLVEARIATDHLISALQARALDQGTLDRATRKAVRAYADVIGAMNAWMSAWARIGPPGKKPGPLQWLKNAYTRWWLKRKSFQ